MHMIVIDNFPFFYAYSVLLTLILWNRFLLDFDAL